MLLEFVAATLTAQLQPAAPLFMLTNRGIRNGAWMRDAQGDHLRLYRLKEPNVFGPNKPPRVGNKVADFVLEPGSPDHSARELLALAQSTAATRNALLVFYIHGFNNDVQDAMDTAWLFRRDFTSQGVAPVVVSITWPSDDRLMRYNQDKVDAVRAGVPVGEFLRLLGEERPPATEGMRVVIITHSMGAVVLSRAAEAIFRTGAPRRPIADEISMIAADLARSDLDTDKFGGKISRLSRHVTAYFSVNDVALAGSGLLRFSTGGRLGSQGALDYTKVPANFDFVNASRDVKPGRNGILGPVESHGIYWHNATFMTDFIPLVQGRPLPAGYREKINGRLWKLIRPQNSSETEP